MERLAVLSAEETNSFLTLPGEKLITAVRQHPVVLLERILLILFLELLAFGAMTYYFSFAGSLFLLFFWVIVIINLGLTGLITAISSWYYHLYIITSRKILEIKCEPIFRDQYDNVFLDQVRTTEIDINVKNFFNELLNVGDVTVAFDRPSHDELFVIANIYNPRIIGKILSQELEAMMVSSPVWFNRNKESRTSKFADDVEVKTI